MFEKLVGRTPGYMEENRYRRFAVMAPYLPDRGELLFQVRAKALSRQPGEICFPGGHIEEGETPVETAVRETMEELLVDRSALTIIAPLDIYTAPYHIVVYPFLANLEGYRGTFQGDEVQEVFTVPFSFFLNNEPEIYHNAITLVQPPDFPHHLIAPDPYPWGKSTFPVLFYRYQDRVIWGMTARFVHNLVQLYRDA